MGEFFTGVVEEAYIGAEYEGVIWSRFVKLRASDGRILNIFDTNLISDDLVSGETITVIITVPFVQGIRGFVHEPTEKEPSNWEGTILEVNWRAPQRDYRGRSSVLYEYDSLALVATPLGQVLIYHEDLPIAVNGAFLQWDETARFDLLAIL